MKFVGDAYIENGASLKRRVRVALFFTLLLLIIFTIISPLYVYGREYYGDRCSICGEVIEGNYWEIDGRNVCGDCYKNSPRCPHCNMPARKFIKVDGRKFCIFCYKGLPECGLCGRKVYKYYTRKDPTGKTIKVCVQCYKKSLRRCEMCNKPFTSKYWMITSGVTGKKVFICNKCKEKVKRCQICSLPVNPRSPPFPDGRYVCSDCKKRALKSRSDYEKILNDIKKIYVRKLGLVHNSRHELNVVDYKTLINVKTSASKERQGIGKGDQLGFYTGRKLIHTHPGGRKSYSIQGRFYVLSRLPREIAIWVTAHEYAHAWYHENVHTAKSLEIVEGFAEWVSYHVLIHSGYPSLAKKLTQRDDVYGRGLRKLLEIEKNGGFNAVIEYIKK